MIIRSLHLKNFRRFTDLVITGIPADNRLVLLIGANGSGKSSVFDGFQLWNALSRDNDLRSTPYYAKKQDQAFNVSITDGRGQQFNSDSPNLRPSLNSLYGRSSFRQLSRLPGDQGMHVDLDYQIATDNDRPHFFIDPEARFHNDLKSVASDLNRAIFEEKKSHAEVLPRYCEPLNESFTRIFGGTPSTLLQLTNIMPAHSGKPMQLEFRKGSSTFMYEALSAGEKEVVNILFNLQGRKAQYSNTVYFIDELDLHLNTKLQYNLLKELTEMWLPQDCQLWTASHSLGFIQYANEYDRGCIIDFADLDLDQPQVLSPRPKDALEVFEVAAPRDVLAQIFQGKRIIYCENEDGSVYNTLLLKDTIFSPATDRNDAFLKARNYNNQCLVDRDFLTDAEVTDLRGTYQFLRLLPFYSIENLLYHPVNLKEYYTSAAKAFDATAYKESLGKVRDEKLADITLGIAMARRSYVYYTGTHPKLRKPFEGNSEAVLEMLKSNDFDTFYKVFPAKHYGTMLTERQHLGASELGKTAWFKTQIERALA